MTKVWIIEHLYYDDSYIVGVFSTEEKAKEAFEKLKKLPEHNAYSGNDCYLYIDERQLDEYEL